ncbi:MAG: GNAT family N-acetyltransferase [Ruminococcaceae bacterium]|nr:GNAT family N-acetyltransferase [Oscillospiraceae bacterium]
MYYISEERERIAPERVMELLKQSYWAEKRTLETIRTSMEHSLLYGVFEKETERQVAFARVITDFATTWYLCDVIVDEAHRGHGIGKMLIAHITSDPRLKDVFGMLLTRDAHGLYSQYGFKPKEGIYMGRDGKAQ